MPFIGLGIRADNRISTRPVLQQTQIAFAVIENMVLKGSQGEIKIEASEFGRVLIQADCTMEFMHVRQ
ncbi:hypothetical protein D3C80_2159610 [compost metagenome]